MGGGGGGDALGEHTHDSTASRRTLRNPASAPSDLASFASLFARFAAASGQSMTTDAVYETLLREALTGAADAGGVERVTPSSTAHPVGVGGGEAGSEIADAVPGGVDDEDNDDDDEYNKTMNNKMTRIMTTMTDDNNDG